MANLSVEQKLLPYLADELGFLVVVQELSGVWLCDPVDCSMPGISPSPPSRVCSNSCPLGLDRFSIYLCLPSFSSSMKLSKYQVRQRILAKMGSFCYFFPIPLKQCFWQCNLWTIYIRFPVRNSDSWALPGHNWSRILEIWVWEGVKVAQSCLTLCDSMNSTVHGVLQARVLEWAAFPFSRGSSQPRDWAPVSCIAGGFFFFFRWIL